jgi:hypothetical protein
VGVPMMMMTMMMTTMMTTTTTMMMMMMMIIMTMMMTTMMTTDDAAGAGPVLLGAGGAVDVRPPRHHALRLHHPRALLHPHHPGQWQAEDDVIPPPRGELQCRVQR